jgi:hypothetical protein
MGRSAVPVGKREGFCQKPFQSVWNASARERIVSNLSSTKPIVALGAHFDWQTHLPGRHRASPARSV